MASKKMTRKWFESMEQFSTWLDSTNGDYDNVVSIVEESGWYKIDLTTNCKYASTAIRRFFNQLEDIKEAYDWKEEIAESVRSNCWHLNDFTMGDGSNNPYPMYSWGVEDLEDGWWYIFLNVRTVEGIKEYEDIQDTLRRCRELDELIPDEEVREAVEVQEQYDEQMAQDIPEEDLDEAMAEDAARDIAKEQKEKALRIIAKTAEVIRMMESFRSAWSRGVRKYADELLSDLGDAVRGEWLELWELTDRDRLEKVMMNGATSWHQYSEGGCSLCYDYMIAERLCTPSELKRTNYGEKLPNAREDWLDVQARALYQAAAMIRRNIGTAIRLVEKEVA